MAQTASFVVSVASVFVCAWAAPQQVGYQLPSGTVSYVRQQSNPIRYQQRPVAYSQPTVSYSQPTVSHRVQAVPSVVSYSRPVVSQVQASPLQRQDTLSQRPIAILRLTQENNFDGTFNYDFEGENGIRSEARGNLKSIPGSEQPAQVMSGSYSYTSPDGTPVVTNWYADETGFHAEGDHLPVSPPIPDEIQRSLEYLRSLPPNPEDHKYD